MKMYYEEEIVYRGNSCNALFGYEWECPTESDFLHRKRKYGGENSFEF